MQSSVMLCLFCIACLYRVLFCIVWASIYCAVFCWVGLFFCGSQLCGWGLPCHMSVDMLSGMFYHPNCIS